MKKHSIRPWVVLFASFMMMFTTIGLGSNGITLLYKPVVESLGFDHAQFSLYYTFSTLAGLVAAPLAGRLLSKRFRNVRLFILIGGFFNMLCFVAYSFCRTLPAFYIVSILRGFAGSLISATPATMLINAWFVDKRSTVTSIAFMGSSAGGLVYTQISNFLLTNWGWQTAYWVLGAVSFVTIILVAILATPTPEDVGAKPFGYDKLRSGAGEAVGNAWQGLTAGQAMKTAPFWLLCIALFLGSIVVMGVQQCVATALQNDFAYSSDVAAGVVSVFMVFICVGKLIIGWIFDKTNVKVGLIYSCVLLVASMVCMVMAASLPMAYAFAVIFGLGNMTSTVISTTVTTTAFGTREYGTIYGTVTMFMTGGMAIGPVISSAIAGATGTYTMAWIAYAAVSVVTTVLLVIVSGLSKRLRVKYPD